MKRICILCLSFIAIVWWSAPVIGQDEPTVRVGISPNPPIAVLNPDGEPTGLVVDIVKDVAAQDKWKLLFVQDSWPNILDKFDSGKIDVILGVGYSRAREQRFAFTSQSLTSNWGSVYRHPDISIDSILDLEGQRIAIPEKGIHSDAIIKLLRGFSIDFTRVSAKGFREALELVREGKADVAVVNRLVGITKASQFGVVNTHLNFNPVELKAVTPIGKGAAIREAIDRYLSVGKESTNTSYQRHLSNWLEVKVHKEFPIWLVWALIGSFLGVMIISAVFILVLRRSVATRTAELSESELRFKDFANSGADRFWETDKNHRFTYVSPSVPNLDRPAEDLIGKIHWEIGQEHMDSDTKKKMKSVFETQLPFNLRDIERRDSNGKKMYVSLSGIPIYGDKGDFKGYRGTVKDETPEVTARLQADELQNRFTDAIENLEEGFTLWDSDNRLVACNSHYKKLHPEFSSLLVPGVEFDDIMREFAKAYLAQEDDNQKSIEEWLAERKAAHDFPTSEAEYFINGRWIRTIRQNLKNGDRISIHSDITEYKNREAELLAAKEKAEIADRSKSEFLANMSHELRTPLNAIIGFSDVFKGETFGPLGNEKYADYAADINRSGYHLLDMINDVLDVSAIEDGKINLTDIEVDIAKTMKSAIRFVDPNRTAKGITLKNHINGNTPKLVGDERRIKQIFINLLSNAVKFTDHDGTIDLYADLQENGDLLIKIADSGIGMDEKGLETAFRKFGQVDGDIAREQEGTGLGLPLTKGLVEAHGGTISIESELGVGTTVNIRLPKERVVGST